SELSGDVAADHHASDRQRELGDLPIDVVDLTESCAASGGFQLVDDIEHSVLVLLSPTQTSWLVIFDYFHDQLRRRLSRPGPVQDSVLRSGAGPFASDLLD